LPPDAVCFSDFWSIIYSSHKLTRIPDQAAKKVKVLFDFDAEGPGELTSNYLSDCNAHRPINLSAFLFFQKKYSPKRRDCGSDCWNWCWMVGGLPRFCTFNERHVPK
jgi:hypothetical protein